MNNFNDYYILADNFCLSAIKLFQVIIDNGNKLIGIGKTEEEAEKNMIKSHNVSDAVLFIPALFLSFHSVELFSKGLLKMNNVKYDNTHNLDCLLKKLKDLYGEKSNIIKSISSFNGNFFEGLDKFKKFNNITNVNTLYEALRYPNNQKIEFYDYTYLKCNFGKGIKYCETLIKKLKRVRTCIINEKNKFKGKYN